MEQIILEHYKNQYIFISFLNFKIPFLVDNGLKFQYKRVFKYKLKYSKEIYENRNIEVILDNKNKNENYSVIWYENLTANNIEIKESEGFWKNGEKEGLWIYWYNNGQKSSEGNYINGNYDGLWTNWDENGQKFLQNYYKYGKKEGLWIEWYENGQKLSEGKYKNGEEERLWTNWYENGQKLSEGKYKNGVKEGLWANWKKNGEKESEEIWKNSKKIYDNIF